MFGKLKQFIGMVGVDVHLEIEQRLPLSTEMIEGVIHISAKQEQQITKVKATIRQAIMEGTDPNRSRRDYHIGEVTVSETPFTIKPGETKDFPFRLSFQRQRTMGQALSEQGGLMSALGTLGKIMDEERDEFWVNGIADVKGAALDPSDSKQVWFD
jgi:sporulation-control protein spo0M